MSKGYNLPDNVSPSDPDAPWNRDQDDLDLDLDTCIICDDPAEFWIGDESYCPACWVGLGLDLDEDEDEDPGPDPDKEG